MPVLFVTQTTMPMTSESEPNKLVTANVCVSACAGARVSAYGVMVMRRVREKKKKSHPSKQTLCVCVRVCVCSFLPFDFLTNDYEKKPGRR